MNPAPPASASPAFSLCVTVPTRAVATVRRLAQTAPGVVTCIDDLVDATGAHRVTFDTDSPETLTWLREACRRELLADLLALDDPVFLAASTGKLGLRVCAPVATGHDVALLDADADRRVVRHLTEHPHEVNRYTGRGRRVALVSDASAVLDLDPLPAEAALPAIESQAVHLRRATGLDVLPLPVAASDAADLAAALRLLAPGFAAAVFVHTRADRIETARAALAPNPNTTVLDTVNDGIAVATTAAVLTLLRRRRIPPLRARVALVDTGRGGDLGGLLMCAGVTDLTLYDPLTFGTGPLRDIARDVDLVVDLSGLTVGVVPAPLVLQVRPEAPPRIDSATTGPRPLHALPGLLGAALATGHSPDPRARLAAAHALAEHTRPGQVLPSLDTPGLTAAVRNAAVAQLRRPPR